MARTEYAKLRSPIGECGTFVAASGTRTAGTPVAVGDLLVYPLETTSSATGVVAYEIPKLEAAKYPGQSWATGERVYFLSSSGTGQNTFTTNGRDGVETPVGFVVELAAASASTGLIHFIGYQVPTLALDQNPSA